MKISVIIPCYNAGRYIGETLASVFAQTRQPSEIIIIDDGSTDDSVERARQAGDGRVNIVCTKNHGPSHARNTGLGQASGDLIAFLDADDRWMPDMLERCAAILEQEPEVQAVFSNFVRFVDGGERLPRDQFSYYPELAGLKVRPSRAGLGRILEDDAFTALVGFTDMPSWPQATMYRHQAVKSLRFDVNVRACEAIDFFLKAVLQGRVAYVDKALVEVRRHATNLTTNYKALVYAKLDAFRRLRSCALTVSQRRALNQRIVRACLDCAVAAFHEGKPGRALAYFAESWTCGHIGWRQLYFGVKLPLLVIRSLLPGTR